MLALTSSVVRADDEAEADPADENEADPADEPEDGAAGEEGSEAEEATEGGEEDDGPKYYHPLTDMPEKSVDITSAVALATHPAPVAPAEGEDPLSVFPLGEEIEVLCGLRNNGDEEFTIDFIQGSLNNKMMFQEHVHNFTEKTYNRTLVAKQEMTASYKFQVPEMGIPTGEFTTAITVFYSSGEGEELQNFSHTFYNDTVKVVEAHSPISSRTVFLYVLVICLIIFAYRVNDTKEAAKATEGIVSSAEDAVDETEFTVNSHVRSGKVRARKTSREGSDGEAKAKKSVKKKKKSGRTF